MINKKQVNAIIMECNPFHEGHKNIINIAKNIQNNNILIIIMSGNFVQRGEPAVFDKYYRTKQLLDNGVDLVLELPVEFCLSSAKFFARANINILNNLNFVDNLIFGSNINDINILKNISMKINSSTEKNDFINKLKSGMSYPKALSEIIEYNLSPNDILAVEYINALNEINSTINPITIERDTNLKSATKHREEMKNKITLDMFSEYLNFKLYHIYKTKKTFNDFYLVNNDFDNKLLKIADKNMSFTDRANILHTKDTTLANIKRILLNILLDIKEIDVNNMGYGYNTNYLRILGIKKEAKYLLKNIFVPYLLSYSKKELSKYFYNENDIDKSIINNIYASDLYNNIAKLDFNEATKKLID